MPAKSRSKSLLAMVALNKPGLPNPAALLASFKEACPTCPKPSNLSQEKDTITFSLSGDMVAVSLMPAPIPWSELAGPCTTAWWWPEASQRMRKHNSHIIVALMGESGEMVERHIRLTHLVAAVVANTNSAGIYWGAGTLAHEPKAFREQAVKLSPDNLELQLWIDMRLEQNADGTYRFFTTGLDAFHRLEVEINKSRRKPEEILNFCYAIIDYILTSGATIKDGETIGRSTDEKIKVQHKPSMWDKKRTVMELAFN
jgi:hypothetical protein